MAITNGYATLSEVKARLDIPSGTTTWDTVIEAAVTASSRQIDDMCSRTFFSTTATRYFTPDDETVLYLRDDLRTVTTLKTLSSSSSGTRTYGYVWDVTDYDLAPYDGPPYQRVEMNPTGLYSFPTVPRGVEIAGAWGYCATGSHPAPIAEACIRQACRLFERNKSPLGIVMGGQIEQASKITMADPDVMALILPYRRFEMVGA